MQISIASLCRGRGMIFIGLNISGTNGAGSVRFRSCDSSETPLPSAFYPADEQLDFASHVAIIPILGITQVITVEEVDCKGSVISSWSKPISSFMATWESRINYRRHPKLTSQLRDFDERMRYTGLFFSIWNIIPDAKTNIVRAAISSPEAIQFKDLSFKCFNENGQEVSIEPVFVGEDECCPVEFSETTIKTIRVSLRIPHEILNYCFSVSLKQTASTACLGVLPRDQYTSLLGDTQSLMQHAQSDPKYDSWFRENRADEATLMLQKKALFPFKPFFSIIVPLYKTPLNFLHEMVASVQNQSYTPWELILVNASPEDDNLQKAINQYLSSEAQIRCISLSENKGISENTNAGISEAKGDFICFFDHDDILEPDLLFEYSCAINRHPETDLLYCDEDKINEAGRYFDPFFKPDFSLDLLRNNNYICHLLCIRKSIINEVGLLDPACDGAQDHDMTLRSIEKARHVHHVEKILYHWRASAGSTASNPESKSYATDAGITALKKHFSRLEIPALVERSRRPFTYKVQYLLPNAEPLVSILIPSKDKVDVLEKCIDSIFHKSSYSNYEIIIIDNNSSNPDLFDYYKTIQEDARVHLITYNEVFNFSAMINAGARKAQGEFLLLLNNDTEVITPNWIERMAGICMRDEVGAVGVKLLYPDNTIQHAGVTITHPVVGVLSVNLPRDNWGYFALNDAEQNLSAVTAACMMTKRNAFEKVGGFTEELSVAFNDIDYCLKLREAKYLIVYTPEVELFHYESLSRGKDSTPEKALRYEQETMHMRNKWAQYYISGDPYFNRNLYQHHPGSQYYKLNTDS